MAYRCPTCDLVTDRSKCPNCNINLGKKHEYWLRQTWWETPEPQIPYQEFISEEEENISDIEMKKMYDLFPDIYYKVKERFIPPRAQLERVIELCKWANKKDGHYSRAIMDAGACYYLLGEYIKAIECWACEADKEDPESLFYLFKTYRKIGWIWHAFHTAKTLVDTECSSEALEKNCSEIIQKNLNTLTNEQQDEFDRLITEAMDECIGLEGLYELI